EIVRYAGEEDSPVVMDNGKLHFEMNPQTTHFTLTDTYGHSWLSNPFDDPENCDEKIATGDLRSALASTLNVYFRLPKKAIDNMYDNYSFSVSRGAYQIRQPEPDTVEVVYTVGDVERKYLIPDALTKERYDELVALAKEAGLNKKRFGTGLSPKKSKKIKETLETGSGEDKDEAAGVVRTYPGVLNGDIYIASSSSLDTVEANMATIGYTEEDQKLDLILTRSTYQYTYSKYTPEDISALQGGGEDDRKLAGELLAANPTLAEKPDYILQRNSQIYTPAIIEEMLNGSDEQAAAAQGLIDAYPNIRADTHTIVELDDEDKSRYFSVHDILDESNYTEAQLIQEKSLFEMAETETPVLFNVTVRYRLDGEDFVAEVPYDQIRFNSDNATITAVSLLPAFGAVGAQEDGSYEDGYLLVPEGSGALIRFNNQKLTQPSYYANVYGYDYGIKRDEFITETKAVFPVFGLLRKEQSFLCVVEDASSFVSIQADINGKTPNSGRSSYNTVNAKATVLHLDQYNVSEKTVELQLMYEKNIPETTLTQRYRFTDSGDYVRLAESYGNYLRERYPEIKEKKASEDIPVSVELIGAIDKRVITAGLPVRKLVPMTTFEQGQSILESLRESGIRNLNARYSGWLKGGVKQKVLTGVHVPDELGGTKAIQSLITYAEEKGIPLYLDSITAFGYDSGLTDGFYATRDAARHITREVAEIPRFSPIYYYEDDDQEPYYLLHPDYAKRNASSLISWLKENGAYGIAFRDIGYLLSADYDPEQPTDRETVKKMNMETLAEAKAAGEKVNVKEGFDFTLPYADLITNMDLSGLHYVLLDRMIPFYQIAIHGSIDYTGQALNMGGDYETELLKSVEYGAGFHFSFSAADGAVTQESYYTSLSGTAYSGWEETAKAAILRYQKEAAGLNRLRITGHEDLTEHVAVTTYEDGTRVYVNYGDEDYAGEAKVPARDYLIAGKGGQ
ncbi:MAG: hypothetical protein K6F61_11645, partial [Clostridiales bacterium]|nr:hypothetical protein [Clostridiales bacterium]